MHHEAPPAYHRLLTRRGFLGGGLGLAAGGVLAAGLAGCGSSSTSSSSSATTAGGTAKPAGVTHVPLQLSWLENVQYGGTYLAIQNGYFAQNGLNISLLPGGPSTTATAIVAEGRALVGLSESDQVATSRASGAPLKIFGVKYQNNPYCIVSMASKPVSSPEELVGLKVGVSSGDVVAFQTLLKLNGIDESKVHVVPTQFDPTPLAAGEFDALCAFITNEPIALEVKGYKVHTFLFSDFKYQVYDDVYIATEETIEKQPEVLAAFLKGERQGWTADFANPTQAVDLAVNVYGKSQNLVMKQQQLENTAQLALMQNNYTKTHGLFTMDPTVMAENVSTLAVAGIKSTVDDLFTTEILDRLTPH